LRAEAPGEFRGIGGGVGLGVGVGPPPGGHETPLLPSIFLRVGHTLCQRV